MFHNRLLQNIRLQSDPTIIYGIAGGKGKLDRPIRRSDIDAKTAYNTYQIDGLPPTPIANPGRDAIAAVLNPANVEDLYFVADGTGGHVFAETLAEHNKNVRTWRKIEAERQKTAAAGQAAATAETSEQQTQSDPVPDSASREDKPAAEQTETAEPAAAPAEPVGDQGQTDTDEPTTATASVVSVPNASGQGQPAVELPIAGVTSAATDVDTATSQAVLRKVPLPRPRPVAN